MSLAHAAAFDRKWNSRDLNCSSCGMLASHTMASPTTQLHRALFTEQKHSPADHRHDGTGASPNQDMAAPLQDHSMLERNNIWAQDDTWGSALQPLPDREMRSFIPLRGDTWMTSPD